MRCVYSWLSDAPNENAPGTTRSSSITSWNLALDEKGNPNIGPFSCGSLVTSHSQTRETTRSGQYWALAHFSRTIRRGARRFDSANTMPAINHVAFANPDGTHVLVIANVGPAANVKVELGSRQAELNLENNSLTTLHVVNLSFANEPCTNEILPTLRGSETAEVGVVLGFAVDTG